MADSRCLLHTENQPTLPDNEGYSFIFDTTKWMDSVKGALGKAAALSTPGPYRGKFFGKVVQFSYSCTEQNVTLYQAILHGGAWVTYKSFAVTAGADPQQFTWEPGSGDWIVYVVAGATKPGAHTCELSILEA